jgi:lysophospholipase L1-like esterase
MADNRGTERLVLHIGDSMVYGTGVGPEERFTHLLESAGAGTRHLNGGFPGTGPDHHLQVLRAWLPLLKPDALVLYLYPGNDLLDLDRPYACCDHGPLLDAGLKTRCPTPRWSFPLRALLARSPPPYPLRAASSHLVIAAHLSAAFSRVVSLLEPHLGEAAGGAEEEQAWARYGGILSAVRELAAERDLPLSAVLLPTRVALEPGAAPSHAQGVAERMAQVARQESLRLLDARDWIAPLAREGSYGHLFGDGVRWDEHLSAEGHRSLAAWLAERL